MTPKECECGQQGRARESRQFDAYVRRRYVCSCGKRWTTAEVRMNGEIRPGIGGIEDLMNKSYSTLDRESVADKLIALAQELLK